jgi:hypothetical protein
VTVRGLLPLLSALLIAAGGTSKATDLKPDWVEHESAEWPREMYLLGVGSADERAIAEDRARAGIARVFTTHVSSALSASTGESSVRKDRSASWTEEISVNEETRSTTDKILEGVEIVQVWQDPQSRQFYALAALDRQQAASRLEARLDALETSARPLRARLEAPEKASALAAAMRLLRLERDRRAVDGELRIVAPARPRRAGVLEEAAARELLSRTSVGLTVTGDEEGAVLDAVRNALAALGFAVQAEAAGADLVGEATVALDTLGSREGWYWSRARVQVVLKDPASARVFLNLSESVRDAARIEGESNRRVFAKISERLRKAIPAAFAAATDNL